MLKRVTTASWWTGWATDIFMMGGRCVGGCVVVGFRAEGLLKNKPVVQRSAMAATESYMPLWSRQTCEAPAWRLWVVESGFQPEA